MAASDLSRSLVDAAARAVESAIVANCPPNVVPVLPPGSGPQDLARGAVAAVLETLAASGAVLEDHDGDWQAALRGLAAEVKAVDSGG